MTRRRFLAVAGGATAATVLPDLVQARAAGLESPLATFVSMPDFLNADVADVRVRPGWKPGDPNSINDSYRQAIALVLDQVAAERPDAVFVAGDLVQGHWGDAVDKAGERIFGPVDTFSHRLRALTNAGRVYYSQWLDRFNRRGLTVYPAVGDHEIGDNPWPADGFKYRAFSTFKAVWAEHFTKTPTGHYRYQRRPVGTPYVSTAYAVRLTPDVALITVDAFARWRDGVHMTVTDSQLSWVEKTILDFKASGVSHIWVQGHVPCWVPVRLFGSSNLQMEGHENSAFWQLLRKHDDVVDFYLNGEAHDMTCYTEGRLAQITSGSLVAYGHENYLLIQVYADRIELTLKRFTGRVLDDVHRLWGVTDKRGPLLIDFDPGVETVGTMTVANTGTRFTNRSGYLTEALSYDDGTARVNLPGVED